MKSKIVDRNFLIENPFLDPRDKELFFDDEDVIVCPSTTTMLDILVEAGVFPSKGMAKKNGWKDRQEIPMGFSETIVGKLKNRLTILNPSEVWDETT